ncbi:hypothetical protein [Rhizobium sp. GCM10022189]|uniref:hypothetical protein n=1 Tax=Rhizobium sp. GCM10022189 TaxID=3252654 RepID=UPI00361AC891
MLEKWIAPLFGSIMIVVLIVVVFGFGPTRSLLCEPNENCLREWISASSGWAGALVTLATLMVLLHQIRVQQRQIDHQLGESPPSMFVVVTSDEEGDQFVKIEIQNWNRRPLRIDRVADFGEQPSLMMRVTRVVLDGKEIEDGQDLFDLGYVVGCILQGREDNRPISKVVIYSRFKVCREPDRYAGPFAIFDVRLGVQCMQFDAPNRDIHIESPVSIHVFADRLAALSN